MRAASLHLVGQPVIAGAHAEPPRRPAARSAASTHEEVLREFGFSDAEIAGLREAKVI